MPRYGRISEERLATVHPALQVWARKLIEVFDHTVVCGHRGEEEQEEAFRNGKSKVHYPDSYHNLMPSRAIDIAPWDPVAGRIDWNDRDRFILLAGHGLQIAHDMGLPMVWGGDWDSDTFMRDHGFQDFPHFQIPRTLSWPLVGGPNG
jgi:peptidoglycan L-alanyl-D-glutamate endopeptidase CwlK